MFTMRLNVAIILLLYIGIESIASAIEVPYSLPAVQKGTNLSNCKFKLEKQGGGWCEIRLQGKHPSISAVWPINLDDRTYMTTGPSAVLTAWNGAAFDEKNLLMYFMGGGHSDYGGNEVYEFNLKNGRWKRLTNPSPLTFFFQFADEEETSETNRAEYCWAPDMRRVPGAPHTYDGIQFSKKTMTIFLIAMDAADGSCFEGRKDQFKGDSRFLFGPVRESGIFEFNPSHHEKRNGLAPLTWRRLATPNGLNLSYPRSLELPNGNMIIGDSTALYPFDPSSGIIGKHLFEEADWGDGLAEFHPTGLVMSLYYDVLILSDLKTKVSNIVSAPNKRLHGKSLAVDKNGSIFSWDGNHTILVIDDIRAPEPRWNFFDWSDAGPPSGDEPGRVYSKWQYIPTHDLFVGLSDHTTGVWVYKHPKAMPGMKLSKTNLDRLIREAKKGSVVQIPPGFYSQGLFINKSLTVKLKNVRLWGVAEDKAIINVNCNGCDVVIEDFYGEGRKAGCLDENCAGIKAEGENFHLTVRRARLDNTVMGILTDDRGGKLVVEDSLIENTGLNDRSDAYGHGLYAGTINSLILRRTTIRNVNSSGHTLKSRAQETILENVHLLGKQGFHSRSIDLPCGGTLQMTNSIIQHGVNSENYDVIALGTEPDDCKIYPSRIRLNKNWIVVDRIGNNTLFSWHSPLSILILKNNHIVNLDKWSSSNTKMGTAINHRLHNKFCRDRADCGLKPNQLPLLRH